MKKNVWSIILNLLCAGAEAFCAYMLIFVVALSSINGNKLFASIIAYLGYGVWCVCALSIILSFFAIKKVKVARFGITLRVVTYVVFLGLTIAQLLMVGNSNLFSLLLSIAPFAISVVFDVITLILIYKAQSKQPKVERIRETPIAQ